MLKFTKHLFILLFLCTLKLSAQDLNFNYVNAKTSGFIVGSSFIDENLPGDHSYHPFKLIYNYSLPLLRFKNIRKSNLFIQFEPQFNPVLILKSKNSIEFGLNVGFLYHYKLSEKSMLFAGIGSGPHFITVVTTSQANGFIFSDNFMVGYRQLINVEKPLELNFQIRFRHISNAGIQEPNLGIDNFFILIGLSKVIPRF